MKKQGIQAEFITEMESLNAMKTAIDTAMRDSKNTVDVGLGETPTSRAALAILFRSVSEKNEFDLDLWLLVQDAGDSSRNEEECSRAAQKICALGWDLTTFQGHPFATHVLVNTRTGRDYFLRLESLSSN